MKIKLTEIQASAKPIRTTWDKDKLNELAQSIKEQNGVIVPIKVRQVDSHYEIVYGNRRFEACKLAGLDEIECLVEGLDDTATLVQGIIENIQREDMQPMDTAKALKLLQDETGWSNMELERRGIMKQPAVGYFLALLDAPKEVQELVVKSSGGEVPEGKVTERHYREVREIFPAYNPVIPPTDTGKKETTPTPTTNLITQVVKKAAEEHLTIPQTRQVAEEVKRASVWGEKAVQDVITRPYTKKETREYEPSPKFRETPVLQDVNPNQPAFSWLNHPAIIAMHDGNRSISFAIDMLSRPTQDRGTARELLRQELGVLKNLVTKLDTIVGVRNEE